jgi:hypothetical protein
MKAKWTVALSAICVAAVLGAAMGVMAFGGSNATTTNASTDQNYPLLTEQQLADLRAMANELRQIGVDRDLAVQLVDAQFEQYVAENLKSYNLTDEEVAGVMDQFNAIDDKMAEIKETAYQMRDNGNTTDEIFDAVAPMLGELQTMQDQLVTTLEGYGISLAVPYGCGMSHDIPQHPHERPGGPEPELLGNDTFPLL